MNPTASLDRAGQDATSGAAPSGAGSMGSGGDDRPTENISLDFGRIDDKTSNAQGQGSGGDDRPSENISLNFGRIDDKTSDAQGHGSGAADDFVLEPGTASAEGSSGLLDFSAIGDDAGAEDEELLAFDPPAVSPPEGDTPALSTFESAYADPTGDRFEDIVTAPRPVADDFIA